MLDGRGGVVLAFSRAADMYRVLAGRSLRGLRRRFARAICTWRAPSLCLASLIGPQAIVRPAHETIGTAPAATRWGSTKRRQTRSELLGDVGGTGLRRGCSIGALSSQVEDRAVPETRKGRIDAN